MAASSSQGGRAAEPPAQTAPRERAKSWLALPEPVRIVCYEDSYDKLLADLALHALDIVIADSPAPSGGSVRAFNHLLGETGVSFFAVPPLARRLARGFPGSLDGAPVLLPLENSALRRALDQWFDRKGVEPRVVAEFEDSALLKVFGADGVGVFTAPTAVEREVCRQYGASVLGRAPEVTERYYAVSVGRRLEHPAVAAISSARPARKASRWLPGQDSNLRPSG